MSRSNKNKIAVTLLSALAFSANDTSAMNSGIKNSGNLATKSSFSTSKNTKLDSKSAQTVGTVGGATSDKNLKRIEKGVSVLKRGLWKKVLIGLGAAAGAAEVANEIAAGVMWAKGKKSDKIFKGECSITNLFRSKIKKDDEQPGPGDLGEQDDQNEYQNFINEIGEDNVNKILAEANKSNKEDRVVTLLALLSFTLPLKLAKQDSCKSLISLTSGGKIDSCSFNVVGHEGLFYLGTAPNAFLVTTNGFSYTIFWLNGVNFAIRYYEVGKEIPSVIEFVNGQQMENFGIKNSVMYKPQ